MGLRSVILIAFTAEICSSSPLENWFPFSRHSHPGWSEPSVYTPPQPTPTYPSLPHHPGFPEPTESTALSSTGSITTTIASGSVSSTSSVLPSSSTLAACGSVSQLVAAFSSTAAPSATPTVPAQLAYDCITSVPFNSSAAVALMDSIRPYLNWQTTIEYLKNPPAEYAQKIQHPYDFLANFERIYDAASSGSYPNEYAFGFDLYTAFQQAHDGHFVLYPDSVASVFSFARTTPLVSVSVDGESLPEVYAYKDVLTASFGNATFIPSPLTMINGENSTAWLLNFSQIGSLQDRDALWNNMFYELAQISLGPTGTGLGTFAGGGRGRLIYPGPDTTLTFANGTSVTTQNFAYVLRPFVNVTSGEDLYRLYFIPPPGEPEPAEIQATQTFAAPSSTAANRTASATATSASTSAAASSTTIPAPGYPSPIVREMSNLNSGYFLDGAGYDDVVVLSVPSFVGSTADEIPFQAVNTFTINRAIAANKTKLIIDVSANGGGTILQGYDLFKQLFPSILPYGATRFRAHEAFNIIGEELSAYSALVPRSLSTNDTVQGIVSSAFNYRTDADVNYQPFTSWAEKYGPHAYGPEPDNFTSIIRWNLSDVLTPDNSGGIYVSGYLNRSNITTQPFAAEDIVIVTDGYCASTCTIFSELMRQQGGVKTIALGGRPNADIIQAVGGVKGTNDYEYEDILYYVETVFSDPLLNTREYYNTTELGQYNDLPLLRTTASVVNARDGLRQGDASETPLQFIYEPADCRIYYTPEMTVDVSAIWRAVADTAFNRVSHCVAGSLNSTSDSTASATPRKRASTGRKMKRKIDKRAHFESLDSIWASQGSAHVGGDSIMIV